MYFKGFAGNACMCLPLEVWILIVRYTEWADIPSIRLVSHAFKRIIDNVLDILMHSADIRSQMDPFNMLNIPKMLYSSNRLSSMQILNMSTNPRCAQCIINKAFYYSPSMQKRLCFICIQHDQMSSIADLPSTPCLKKRHASILEDHIVMDDESMPFSQTDEVMTDGLPERLYDGSIKKKCKTMTRPRPNDSVPFLNHHSFSSIPNFIVDRSVITACVSHVHGHCRAVVSSLQVALALAKEGDVIQIRRGSVCTGTDDRPFELSVSLKIYGESVQEYRQRIAFASVKEDMDDEHVPPPATLFVETNSALVALAPCIVSNLIIESGHCCELCNPLDMDPFSAINNESLLLIDSCFVYGFQGTGVVSRGPKANLIVRNSHFESPYYCIYVDESELVANECYNNTFLMHPETAICSPDTSKSDEWTGILHTRKLNNSFSIQVRWPEHDEQNADNI